MTNTEAAQAFHANMNDLRHGRITPDQMRARNRALRELVGDTVYQQAKVLAIAASNR